MSHLTVSPAYGRDYKSGKAARADWDANKDFVIQSIAFGGSYVNKGQSQELLDAGITEVMIRFKQMQNFVLVKLSIVKTRQGLKIPNRHVGMCPERESILDSCGACGTGGGHECDPSERKRSRRF